MDTISQTPVTHNTQGENKNTVLTIEKRNNSDALSVTFKGFSMNDTGYYELDSDKANDAKGDPVKRSKGS